MKNHTKEPVTSKNANPPKASPTKSVGLRPLELEIVGVVVSEVATAVAVVAAITAVEVPEIITLVEVPENVVVGGVKVSTQTQELLDMSRTKTLFLW